MPFGCSGSCSLISVAFILIGGLVYSLTLPLQVNVMYLKLGWQYIVENKNGCVKMMSSKQLLFGWLKAGYYQFIKYTRSKVNTAWTK